MELLQVVQCQAWCASEHFWMNYEGLYIVIIAFVALILTYAFKTLYENNILELQDKVTVEAAKKVIDLGFLFGVLCIAGFLIYVLFFFKPQYASELLHNITKIDGPGSLAKIYPALM